MKRMAIAALAVAVSLSASVSAQQGQGKGKGNGKGESSTATFAVTLVTDNNSNGVPNWGDQISFQIFTTETTDPRVQVMCFQDGDVVYGALWQPNNSVLTLSSRAWQGGRPNAPPRSTTSRTTRSPTLRRRPSPSSSSRNENRAPQ